MNHNIIDGSGAGSLLTNSLFTNPRTPDDSDWRLVSIKLSARWQAAYLKSIVGKCAKLESGHLLNDSAYSPASETRDAEEPELCSDGSYQSNRMEEDANEPEAAKVQSIGTKVDAALQSRHCPTLKNR